LFPVVGETQAVPLATPKVTNKQTTQILTFAQGIDISKQLFDDNMHWNLDFVKYTRSGVTLCAFA